MQHSMNDVRESGAAPSLIVRGTLVRVASLEADGFDHPTAVPALLSRVRQGPQALDIITLVQTLPHTSPEFSYPMEWDNAAAIPVSTFENWWNVQVDRKTRNVVRKSEKQGIVVSELAFDEPLVRGIVDIYNECPVRHGKAFWHYGKDFDTVKRENASFLERSVFLAALWQDEIVGFAKMVISNDGLQARLMQILSKVSHRDKSPTNALIAEAVRACAARNIGHLCYGRFSYGKKQRDSLTDFKENNGFKRVEVPRYYIPLTVRGKLAMRLGLQHRLADRVPESMLAVFRDARRRWYASAPSAS